jgi:hypothetical protein
MLSRMNDRVIMCTEPACTGEGKRPAEGTVMGHVHMIFVCKECADKAGVTLGPLK